MNKKYLIEGAPGVAFAIFLWSSLGVVVRIAEVDVQYLIFYSNFLSLFFIGPIVYRRRKTLALPRGKTALGVIALGPVTLLNTFMFLYALKHTTIANAQMTHYIAPVVVAVLAAIFLKERFTVRIFLAIAISSTGLWILLGMTPSDMLAGFNNGDANVMGLIAGLISGVAYALLVVIVRAVAPRLDPLLIVLAQNVMMCLLLLPFIKEFPLNIAWVFVLSGILHSTIAPLVYVNSLRTVQANVAAILGYIEPVSAILLAFLILGEIPAISSVYGGVLILFSGYMLIRSTSHH